MFLQEARLAAMLDHANIAQVHDIGEEGGTFFFTMEYLHGEDVRRITKKLGEREQAHAARARAHIVIDAAAGVHFAHEKKESDGQLARHRASRPVAVEHRRHLRRWREGRRLRRREDRHRPRAVGRVFAQGEARVHVPGAGRAARRSIGAATCSRWASSSTSSRRGQRLFKGAERGRNTARCAGAKIADDRPRSCPTIRPVSSGSSCARWRRSPERRYQSARELQLDLEAFARDQKLEISSAALAEWMETSFGPKREIWHTLPLLPGDSSDHSGSPPAEKTAATRKVPLADLVAAGATPTLPSRGRRTALAVAVAMLLIVVGGGAFAWRDRWARAAPVQAGAGTRNDTVMLVAENGSVAIEPRAPAPAAPTGGSPSRRRRPRRRAPPTRPPSPPHRLRAAATPGARRAPPVPRRCRRRSPAGRRRFARCFSATDRARPPGTKYRCASRSASTARPGR